jgi:hypothetical protein
MAKGKPQPCGAIVPGQSRLLCQGMTVKILTRPAVLSTSGAHWKALNLEGPTAGARDQAATKNPEERRAKSQQHHRFFPLPLKAARRFKFALHSTSTCRGASCRAV